MWGILAYVDLDGFKQINDRHGHAAGDEALQAFASGVRDLIRSDDVFARIGGDEFLLFLPVDSEAEGAWLPSRADPPIPHAHGRCRPAASPCPE